MKSNKKLFSIIGIALSLVVVVCGIVFAICGPVVNRGGSDVIFTKTYESGHASFQLSDYYTYSVNNGANAAEAASTTATNVRILIDVVCEAAGFVIAALGLLSAGYFLYKLGKVLDSEALLKEEKEKEEVKKHVAEVEAGAEA